jgi:Zn-dependent peptidase ImmA (M78 family)/DNA-binding XRE family transcriptional regulator
MVQALNKERRNMIDLATLGKSLKEARQNCGVTQEEAASAIGVPRTAIVHIEAGNRSLSTLELAELAKLYRRPVAEFFAEDKGEDDVVVALRLSSECKDLDAIEREVLRCVQICKEGYQLESILERKPRLGPPAYDVPLPKNYAQAVEQGEEVAEAERRRVGMGNAPIPDMADLISSQGIWASGVELPDEISGLFLHQRSIGLVVLVHFGHKKGRKRFSYAHEYGHALMDRKRSLTITSIKHSHELMEKRANAFAASFLMPKAGVEEFLSSVNKGSSTRKMFHVYDVATETEIEAERRVSARSQEITFREVALLQASFGVSYQAAAYRLSDLGFINREGLKTLLEQLEAAKRYLRLINKDFDDASQPSDRELISQVLPLVVEAYRQEEISKGKLMELSRLLKVKGSDLADMA